MREIPPREEFLDQLFPDLALHEGIRRDLPHEPGGPHCAVSFNCQIKEPLRERHGKRVLSPAGRIAVSVEFAQCRVLDRDVWRITDNGVVLLAEGALERLGVLDVIVVFEFIPEYLLGIKRHFRSDSFKLPDPFAV